MHGSSPDGTPPSSRPRELQRTRRRGRRPPKPFPPSLAGEVLAPVLAELRGIADKTAVKWAAFTGHYRGVTGDASACASVDLLNVSISVVSPRGRSPVRIPKGKIPTANGDSEVDRGSGQSEHHYGSGNHVHYNRHGQEVECRFNRHDCSRGSSRGLDDDRVPGVVHHGPCWKLDTKSAWTMRG